MAADNKSANVGYAFTAPLLLAGAAVVVALGRRSPPFGTISSTLSCSGS